MSGVVRLASIACLLSMGIVAPAFAAPKDAQAEKALRQAMEDDYLDTRFDDAEKRLRKALDVCGTSGCSPGIKAKLLVGIGTVLAGGRENVEQGAEAFAKALELDPDVAPDPDYLKSEVRKAFEQAKKAKPKPSEPDPDVEPEQPSEDVTHTPPSEQRLNTPIPIFVGMSEATLKKSQEAKLYYVPPSGKKGELSLSRSAKGFRGQIPCSAVKAIGAMKYWIVIKDNEDNETALGTEGKPNVTEIKKVLEGKPPSLPGLSPPEPCGASTEEVRAKSSLRQCVDSGDCPANESCSGNECLLKPQGADVGSSTDEDKSDVRRNWFTLTFAPDFSIVSGEDVCSREGQTEQHFYCFRGARTAGIPETSRYVGTPTADKGNNVNAGLAVSTLRLMLGYDRIIAKNFGIGARVGFAFNGTSGATSVFVPVHAEGRVTYAIGENPYGSKGVRPWFAIGGGLAQIDSSLDVEVLEDGEQCGAAEPERPSSQCAEDYNKAGGVTGRDRIQTLAAVKQAGLGFAGATAGISFMPAELFAINAAFRFNVTFPVVVPVLSPEVGVSVGF